MIFGMLYKMFGAFSLHFHLDMACIDLVIWMFFQLLTQIAQELLEKK
jgi:hypothetical protein